MTRFSRFTTLALFLVCTVCYAQKISQLPAYPAALDGSEQIPASNLSLSTTTSYYITPAQLLTYVLSYMTGAQVGASFRDCSEGVNVLTYTGSCAAAGGTGTVTSITAGTGLIASPGSPITVSGTLGLSVPVNVSDGGTGIITLTGLALGNGSSPMSAYGGTSCTGDQFIESLNGSGAATCGSAIPNADKFTATSGQTTFTLSFAPASANATLVVLSGAVLTPGDDYTVSGTTLTLVTGAVAGQRLVARY